MLDYLRSLPALWRGLIAAGCGIVSAVFLFYAVRKWGLDKSKRREMAGAGGVAIGIIVWLILLSGETVIQQSTAPSAPQSPLFSPLQVPLEINPQNVDLGPGPILYVVPPEQPQVQSTCGCQMRQDAWYGFIQNLWNTLDGLSANTAIFG